MEQQPNDQLITTNSTTSISKTSEEFHELQTSLNSPPNQDAAILAEPSQTTVETTRTVTTHKEQQSRDSQTEHYEMQIIRSESRETVITRESHPPVHPITNIASPPTPTDKDDIPKPVPELQIQDAISSPVPCMPCRGATEQIGHSDLLQDPPATLELTLVTVPLASDITPHPSTNIDGIYILELVLHGIDSAQWECPCNAKSSYARIVAIADKPSTDSIHVTVSLVPATDSSHPANTPSWTTRTDTLAAPLTLSLLNSPQQSAMGFRWPEDIQIHQPDNQLHRPVFIPATSPLSNALVADPIITGFISEMEPANNTDIANPPTDVSARGTVNIPANQAYRVWVRMYVYSYSTCAGIPENIQNNFPARLISYAGITTKYPLPIQNPGYYFSQATLSYQRQLPNGTYGPEIILDKKVSVFGLGTPNDCAPRVYFCTNTNAPKVGCFRPFPAPGSTIRGPRNIGISHAVLTQVVGWNRCQKQFQFVVTWKLEGPTKWSWVKSLTTEGGLHKEFLSLILATQYVTKGHYTIVVTVTAQCLNCGNPLCNSIEVIGLFSWSFDVVDSSSSSGSDSSSGSQ